MGNQKSSSTTKRATQALQGQAGQQETEFNPIVFDAAGDGEVEKLCAALVSHPHLIDTPNPSIFEQGRTPMHIAASNGRVKSIETLVRFNSQAIDASDKYGNTPMHMAVHDGRVEVVEALVRLESKAIDVPNNFGMTPFFLAAYVSIRMVETLLRLGSRGLDAKDRQGLTMMHRAAQQGNVSLMEKLVQLGSISIDVGSEDGMTPMHLAAKIGKEASIEALVRLGSRALDTANSQGTVPMTLALRGYYSNSVKVMKALGVSTDVPLDEISPLMITRLCEAVAEEEICNIRYRVYFSWSLAHRLLFDSDRLAQQRLVDEK